MWMSWSGRSSGGAGAGREPPSSGPLLLPPSPRLPPAPRPVLLVLFTQCCWLRSRVSGGLQKQWKEPSVFTHSPFSQAMAWHSSTSVVVGRWEKCVGGAKVACPGTTFMEGGFLVTDNKEVVPFFPHPCPSPACLTPPRECLSTMCPRQSLTTHSTLPTDLPAAMSTSPGGEPAGRGWVEHSAVGPRVGKGGVHPHPHTSCALHCTGSQDRTCRCSQALC